MKHWERLVALGREYHQAPTIADKMSALYDLRQMLNEVDPLELFISIDTALRDHEPAMDEFGKDLLRHKGYQFPEDLDNVPEMLCGGE